MLLKSILNTFEGNNVESKEFNFYFPRLNVNDFKDLQKLILNQKLYFIKTNQIIKKIEFKQEKEINNNLKNEHQIKSKNHKTKKKRNKKNSFY